MCGIAGFVSAQAQTDPKSVLSRMTGAIRHRGPDDEGFYLDDYAALGHRRLSIIDVGGGHQPMTNETQSLWITYNGEVFNHLSLKPDLERSGHVYRTRCDTETILHAYEEYGPRCLDRFRGMFAFAIWDKQARTLFCARDRLGIKPFYYRWDGRLFAFASEIKALLTHPMISPQVEESRLADYLSFGYGSDGNTLFSGIKKLLPGHHLTFSLKGDKPEFRVERYWDVPVNASGVGRDEGYWVEETRRRIEETVSMRLMSDVPLGMFLSGGIDSAVIGALMKWMRTGPVETFSVGYPEQRFSELSAAAESARAIGTEHREIIIGMDEFFQALPTVIWHEDEPVAWPSSVSLYFLSKLAAEHVKVVLTGEGSDEIFGGYERYRWNLLNHRGLRLFKWMPAGARRKLRSRLAATRLLNGSVRRKLQHTFLGREPGIESLYLDNFYCAFSAADLSRVFPGSSTTGQEGFLRYWNARPDATLLGQMLYADQKTYLVELLMKQDQMSMACSIESRVPYLDHTLVEFAAGIPDQLKIHGSVQKRVLRKAVEDLLPERVRDRKKRGFPTPLPKWLLDPGAAPVYEALRSTDGILAEYLDRNQVEQLIQRHQNGQEDCTDRIWRLLNLEMWGRIFLMDAKDPWNAGTTAPSRPQLSNRC